ncbi:unnamed protein product, partial [Allacma fusca]
PYPWFLARNEFCCRKRFKKLRNIQLLIIRFNIGYAPVVYLFKMLSMAAAVLCGYLVHFSSLIAWRPSKLSL